MPCAPPRSPGILAGKCPTCGHGGQKGPSERVDLTVAPTDCERWSIVGNTRSGKSELLKRLISAWLAAGVPVVCFDVDDEMSRHGGADPKATRGPLRDRCTVKEFLEDPDRWINRGDVSLSIVPEDQDEDASAVARQFVAIAKWIKARGQRGREAGLPAIVFVIEEVGYFANPEDATKEMRAAIRKLRGIMVKWAKRGVAVVLVSQYPTQTDSGIRTQVSRWVCFKITKASQRQTLAVDTGKPFAEALQDLEPREFAVRDLLASRSREEAASPPLRGPHRDSPAPRSNPKNRKAVRKK